MQKLIGFMILILIITAVYFNVANYRNIKVIKNTQTSITNDVQNIYNKLIYAENQLGDIKFMNNLDPKKKKWNKDGQLIVEHSSQTR